MPATPNPPATQRPTCGSSILQQALDRGELEQAAEAPKQPGQLAVFAAHQFREDLMPREGALLPNNPGAVEALLVPGTVAAALAGVSRTTWWRLFAFAKTPAATRLGRKVLFNRAETIAWIEAKCPNRQTWEAIYAQRKRLRVI